MAEKKRTAGVTTLAVLSGIAAFISIVHTLQMLHLFPIKGPLGQFSFFTFSLAGAIIYGSLALIYIWLTRAILDLNIEAWWFLMVISLMYLIFDVIALVGGTPIEALTPSLFITSAILIICVLPGTQKAFNVKSTPIEY
jgi:hypothetical protein